VLEGVSVDVRDARSGATRRIVRGVDLRVEPGEHWAILGPNGAGKTTLLHTAAGAREPTAGTVTVLGERHGAEGLRDPRLRIGVIESVPPVFAGRLTAVEVVTLRSSGPAALLGERRRPADAARARELLERFGCAQLTDRRYGDCSRGERQRIMLARALMREPSVLLLDEPTTGLDLPGREALLAAMAAVAAQHDDLATITVTHHVEELAASTTHALLLRDGAVVAVGPAPDTLTDERLSACFGIPIAVSRDGERWWARAATGSA
jgi:iron complex transport system ATP-binding protein